MKFFLFATLIGLIAVAGAAPIGAPAPELQLQEFIKGTPVKLADLKGKKLLVLHFWGTQCKPCEQAVPLINAAQEKYAGRDVEFLAIGSDDPTTLRKDRAMETLAIPIASDDMVKTADAYLRPGDRLPTDAVISKDGILLWLGPTVELDGVLEEILAGRYDLAAAADFDRFDREMTEVTRKKDYRKALALLDARLKRFPDDVLLTTARANLLAHMLDSREQALADLAAAIERKPKTFEFHETRLKLLRERGASDKALIDAYARIAREFTDQPMLLVQLSENLMRQPAGSFQLISVYTLAHTAYTDGKFTSDRERGRAAGALARSYYYVGRLEDAVKYQKEALQLLRNTPDARRAENDLKLYQNAWTVSREIEQMEKKNRE